MAQALLPWARVGFGADLMISAGIIKPEMRPATHQEIQYRR